EQALPAPEQAVAVYVQVGAFSSRANAENLRSRLEDEFGWLKDTVQVLAIGNLWRLHLGPYRTQDDARSVAERIESQLSIKPLLVVRWPGLIIRPFFMVTHAKRPPCPVFCRLPCAGRRAAAASRHRPVMGHRRPLERPDPRFAKARREVADDP